MFLPGKTKAFDNGFVHSYDCSLVAMLAEETAVSKTNSDPDGGASYLCGTAIAGCVMYNDAYRLYVV